MIDLTYVDGQALSHEPYQWAFIDRLFTPQDASALVASFPQDQFKTVKGNDGEKGYEYEVRAIVNLGSVDPCHPDGLSLAWQTLTSELLSSAYRGAMSRLTGLELMHLPIEINIFHYGPMAWLGPHVDLSDKVVTHVFYFNPHWDEEEGGCLTILKSPSMTDAVAKLRPLVGHSAVLVRSETSWHAVSRVSEHCHRSRRSMTVTFYRPGSISTMWPPGDTTLLHPYQGQ
jgi:hypothetical protein